MTIFSILIGIVGAGFVFAAFFWSLSHCFGGHIKHRNTQIILALSTILGMSAISLDSIWIGYIAAFGLISASLYAFYLEKGWDKLFSLIQLTFGITLALGIPFTGH